MVRTIDEEIKLRKQQRETYFEDPSYRKWSDVIYTPSIYANWSEKGFLAAYLLGDCDSYKCLNDGNPRFQSGEEIVPFLNFLIKCHLSIDFTKPL